MKLTFLILLICIMIQSGFAKKIYITNADLVGTVSRTLRSIDSYASCSTICDKSNDCQAWSFFTTYRNCMLINDVNQTAPFKKSTKQGC